MLLILWYALFMSSLSKKLVIFGAEYLVVLAGIIFVYVGFSKTTSTNPVLFIFSGVVLILVSLFVAHILKKLFHKKRPPKNQELFIPADRYAFPSEHATALAALSVIVVSENVLLGVVVIITGLVIVICRVLARVHRPQDMVLGSMIGAAIAYSGLLYLAPLVEKIFN